MSAPLLTEGEQQLLAHIIRWGSDGYPIHKFPNGKWVIQEAFGVKGPPTVFRTKREAVAYFENFIDILTDAKAGRGIRAGNPDLTVAHTILEQLGAGRFQVMTGAKHFLGGPDFLQFRLPKANKGIRVVRITLTPRDTYSVAFHTLKGRLVASYNDVYGDQLQTLFTKETGLYTSMGTMGRNPGRRPRGRSELSESMAIIGAFTRPIIDHFPSGKWGFVGRVPMELMYTMKDGSPVDDDLARSIQHSGAGLFMSRIRRVVFNTEAEAQAALLDYESSVGRMPRTNPRKRHRR